MNSHYRSVRNPLKGVPETQIVIRPATATSGEPKQVHMIIDFGNSRTGALLLEVVGEISQTVAEVQEDVGDINDSLDGVNTQITTINNNVSTIQQTAQSIQTQVTQTQTTLENDYATKDQLSSSVSSLSSTIQQTASDITITISDVQSTVNSQGSQITTLETYIGATSRGLEIGRNTDDVKAVLGNNELAFYDKGNTKLAWLNSDEGLGATGLSIGNATTANQRWRVFTRQDGSHLTFTRHS